MTVGELPIQDKYGKNTDRFVRIIRLSMTIKENKRKARKEIHEKACHLFKRVFDNLTHVDQVEIQINPPNPEPEKRFKNIIMRMTMNRSTSEKIKWNKLKPKELPQFLESYWVAPELIKDST